MAEDPITDPESLRKLEELKGVKISDESSMEMTGRLKVKELRGGGEMPGKSLLEMSDLHQDQSSSVRGSEMLSGWLPRERLSNPQDELSRGLTMPIFPPTGMAGSSQDRLSSARGREMLSGWLQRERLSNPQLQSKELNDVLLNTQRLYVYDRFFGAKHRHNMHYKLNHGESDISFLRNDGEELKMHISWSSDDHETYIVWKHPEKLNLQDMTSALAPLCLALQHITVDYFCDDMDVHGIKPFIPMRSVLTVCLRLKDIISLADTLLVTSGCFPNTVSLELDGDYGHYPRTQRYYSDTPLSSLRELKLDLWNMWKRGNLDNLFLSISSSCHNIKSLIIRSPKSFKWDRSSTDIKSCKLPNLTDIHLESRWSDEHYALQLVTNLLHACRVMSPSLKFVKVESVQLGEVVIKSVEWSRTSSDCELKIKGTSAAVPITDFIDLTTSDLMEVTVLSFDKCKIDFGQSTSRPQQSPKELGTLREIRFLGAENSLSESDKNKLSEMYPTVKVTEKLESQESHKESQQGAGISSKLDKTSYQSLQTSSMDKLVGEKVEVHEETDTLNPAGGEEEMESEEGEEKFDVTKESLHHKTVPDEGYVEPIKVCCKRVGAEGGKLQLESFGIELEIPAGAIDSEEPQEISLRVLTDTPNLGNTKEEMSVCFGVECVAPDDLVLRLPVTYTIPHCALATRYSSLEAVLYTGEGEYTSDAEVKERIILTRSGIPHCIIKRDVLRLQMDHFSWLNLRFINNLFFRGKQMYCLPFAEKPPPEERVSVILRVHLYDDIKGNEEMIMQKENRLGFGDVHPATELPINVTGEDVTMICLNEDNRVGEAIVKYDALWRGRDRMRSFNLDLTGQPDRVVINLQVGQNEQPLEELLCLLRFTSRCRSSSPQPHNLGQLEGATARTSHQQTEKTLHQQREETPESNKRVVTDGEITKLSKLLPVAEYSEVCEELGFGHNYTQGKLAKHSQDSTAAFKEVLQEWKDKGGFMVDLDIALHNSNLGGLISEYKIGI